MPKTLRPYTEAFEQEKAHVIAGLIDDLETLGKEPTGYRIYTSEIQSCLSVGLLLAVISVSASLLELFVRDLTIAARIQKQRGGDMRLRGEVERQLEEDKSLRFDSMLRETNFSDDDVKALSQFYAKIRIPFAHGLVRRLTSDCIMPERCRDSLPDYARVMGLEDRLEDNAIDEIRFVVQTMKKYRPWVVEMHCL